jgi:hypothetical protein
VDFNFAFLVVAILALLIPVILGSPRFLLDLLDLRKRWRAEFPQRSLMALASEVNWVKLTPQFVRTTIRLIVFRFVTALLNIALTSYFLLLFLTGNPPPVQWWIVLDTYLLIMVGFGVYVLTRARPLTPLVKLLRRIEMEEQETHR